MSSDIGRLSNLKGFPEVSILERGMDFRKPEYRREVFLRFYEFSVRTKGFPGCVYFLMPYFAKRYDWDMETKLWFAYINGNTQHPVTSWLLINKYPTAESFISDHGEEWFNENWSKLDWDMDRRYQKKEFPKNAIWYANLDKSIYTAGYSFQKWWDTIKTRFPSFGRLSAFSYLEYLRIMGVDQDCDDIFLEDLAGSKSHRNGLAIVLGRDDLDFHHDRPKYSSDQISWLKLEARELLAEIKRRTNQDFQATYYTLESVLCTYKSWHRRNRRYPNVYADMLHDRIKSMERKWPEVDFSIFWQARKETLAPYYLLENSPEDLGVSPTKQNLYLDTGKIPMLDFEWECFSDNGFPHNKESLDMRQVGVGDPSGNIKPSSGFGS